MRVTEREASRGETDGRAGLWASLRSYYRGSGDRDQREFYDLESTLPYFDNVNRILCRHKRKIILRLLGEREPYERYRRGHLLDVGCGNGYFSRILAAGGFEVCGLDISPRKIAKATAASAGAANPTYLAGDITLAGRGEALDRQLDSAAAPGAGGRFEAILLADVIEHVPQEPRRLLRALAERLAPAGRLIVSVPSRLCVGDPGHIWRFLPDQWAAIFEESGYRIRAREVSRIFWYRLPTPLPLAEVFLLEVHHS